MSNRQDLTKGSIIKNIWILALPMMLSSLLQTALNIIDMFWVGKLGSSAIAAVAMSGVILMAITVIIIGVGRGTSTMISRFVGAKQIEQANIVAIQSLFVGLVIFGCKKQNINSPSPGAAFGVPNPLGV